MSAVRGAAPGMLEAGSLTGDELVLFDALAWRLKALIDGWRAGAHRSRLRGAGEHFADIAPLLAFPDPRRIDLRRSLRDPFGAISVRRFERPANLDVHAVVDWTGSLGATGNTVRARLAAVVAAGLAQGAMKSRDRFALAAVPGEGHAPLVRPPLAHAGLSRDVLAALTSLEPAGRGWGPLAQSVATVPARRTLVFLISDFEVAPEPLADVLALLADHVLCPIWLRDTGLDEVDGRFGLADVADLETGERRVVLMRPAFAARYRRARAERVEALRATFAAYGRRPIELTDDVDPMGLAADLAETPL